MKIAPTFATVAASNRARGPEPGAWSPEEQLAREWALFQSVEAGELGGCWTCWEVDRPVVVVGRNSRTSDEVKADTCDADGVTVLRRFSGGGAVVLAAGCLSYAVAVPFHRSPHLADIAATFRFLLGRIVGALALPGLRIEGQADIAIDGRKVSGSAQRRGRRALIQHGTLLFDFDPSLATRYLKEPARQPAYRAGRRHAEFIGNLPVDSTTLRERLASAWAGFLPLDVESEANRGDRRGSPRDAPGTTDGSLARRA
jgi:lipoate---protein ligase